MNNENIPHIDDTGEWPVSRGNLSALAIAVWRVQRRIQRAEIIPEAVRLACEGIADRLNDIGLRWEEMVGEPYDENMRVRVIETRGSRGLRIAECLSPAVYLGGQLISPAEVVVAGEATKG